MAKQTILQDKVKLRHSTGAYLHMSEAPTEEDMIFFLSTQKHKAADMKTIIKAFGEHKGDIIESVLRLLHTRMQIKREGADNNIITLI